MGGLDDGGTSRTCARPTRAGQNGGVQVRPEQRHKWRVLDEATRAGRNCGAERIETGAKRIVRRSGLKQAQSNQCGKAMKQNHEKAATPLGTNLSHYINADRVEGYVEKCEPGHHTASAAFDVAVPGEGSAGIDDCGEPAEDAAADQESSALFACAGAAAIRSGENGGLPRSGLKMINREKSVDSRDIFCPKYNE
jgi:hypothetical protein